MQTDLQPTKDDTLSPEFRALFDELSKLNQCLLVLIAASLARKTCRLHEDIFKVSQIRGPKVSPDAMGVFDWKLFRQLEKVAGKGESQTWMQAIKETVSAGDRDKKDALVELMRRRVAN